MTELLPPSKDMTTLDTPLPILRATNVEQYPEWDYTHLYPVQNTTRPLNAGNREYTFLARNDKYFGLYDLRNLSSLLDNLEVRRTEDIRLKVIVDSSLRFDLTNIPLTDITRYSRYVIDSVNLQLCVFPKRKGERDVSTLDRTAVIIEADRIDTSFDQVVEGKNNDVTNNGAFEYTVHVESDVSLDSVLEDISKKQITDDRYSFDHPIFTTCYRIAQTADAKKKLTTGHIDDWKISTAAMLRKVPTQVNQTVTIEVRNERLVIEPNLNTSIIRTADGLEMHNTEVLYQKGP